MRPLLVLILTFAALPALADSMRCGTRLITDGDSMDKVRALCGDPADISRSEILRVPRVWIGGRPYAVSSDAVPVPVETWIYNFGKYKLMRRLRFEDGIVVNVETLEHGY